MTISRYLLVGIVLASFVGCASVPKTKAAAANKPLPKAEAEAILRRIDAERDEAQCQQAVQLWERGKSAEAEQLLKQVTSRNPRHSQARRLLADLALSRGDFTGAEQILLSLMADDPSDEAAKASYAWLLESQGHSEQAQSIFAALDPTFAASHGAGSLHPQNR